MKIYISRHGQVADDAEYLGDVAYPKGDIPLSALGREQARLLGVRLRDEGFSGIIYSSPFMRTMETADIIAREVGATVVPTPAFHEIFRGQGMVDDFVGKSAEELKRAFSCVAADAVLPEHWWARRIETAEDVRYRVSLKLRELIPDPREEKDILLVGHGASVDAMCVYLTGEVDPTPFFNCSYTLFDSKIKRIKRNDSLHLAISEMTYNRVHYLDKERKITLPDGLLDEKGVRVLHIGDTFSYTYDWYISLVKAVKPDVIIHTGDTADEMKVSRDIPIRERYYDRASAFLNKLSSLTKRLIWVPGNNDIPEKITELCPEIEYYDAGSVIDIGGVKLSLAHIKKDLSDGAEVYLYGHSTRYETWSPARNTPDSAELYLNAMWSANIIHLPSKRLYTVELPK